MPRGKRLLGSSGYMHIVARGINRQDIFFDDNDRKSFMNIMLHLRKEMDFDITAYCLMDNHVHLIIHDEKKRFSLIMKRLLICYVYHFNEKYNRTGHLFENRFKSECIESIRYLAAAVKYYTTILKRPGSAKPVIINGAAIGNIQGKHIYATQNMY